MAEGRAHQTFPLPLDLRPMESKAVDALPVGQGWQFEPKHDGFRCLAFRASSAVRLQSRNQKSLDRYFPELVDALTRLAAPRFVIDGEIVIPGQPFETLQLRLHPAATRIAHLAEEHPATFVAFDLLAGRDGSSLLESPLAERRATLEALLREAGRSARVTLSKATRSRTTALRWLGSQGLDGVMAKALDQPYRPGRRTMQKYKPRRTIDCVVGGLYRDSVTGNVEYLLLGLYDAAGRLNYVGRLRAPQDPSALARKVEPLIGGNGFSGRKPGGRSRWSGRERPPVPLFPELVAEVEADQISAGFMRHGARLLRWRDDKRAEDCTMDQIA